MPFLGNAHVINEQTAPHTRPGCHSKADLDIHLLEHIDGRSTTANLQFAQQARSWQDYNECNRHGAANRPRHESDAPKTCADKYPHCFAFVKQNGGAWRSAG